MTKKTTDDSSQQKIALLIDGDNAQPSKIEHILRETERHGFVTIRRVYGDWTKPQLSAWKDVLHKFAIQPIQQFRYSVGKNSTDSALIIDAMDILHNQLVDGFSIVSSDSDFTRLATRIREEGFFAMGIGEKKTPEAFVKACDKFIFTELLEPEETKKPKAKGERKRKLSAAKKRKLSNLLTQAYDMASGESDWVYLAQVGISLRKIYPGFDPRMYGCKQLLDVIEMFPKKFQIKKDENTLAVYVRFKS